MTILPVIALSAILLLVAYFTYGRFVMRWLGVDPARRTPAVEMEDGLDYVPAAAPVVLGGHFTAIAAAGPVVGPILAGLAFGWLPALLWILLGAIFIGGVHDSGSLLASVRHKANSITQVVRQHMSRTAYLTFLMFVWISLIYVIIAFADVTAGTFAAFQKFDVPIDGQVQSFHVNGGAVVIGATAYLVLSVITGLILRYTRTPWWLALSVVVALLAWMIWQSPAWALWLSTHGLPFMNAQGFGPELTKRRITSQLLQLRKDIERRQQLLNVLNQQMNVVSTHLHNLDLVQQGETAKLPDSEEMATDAAAASPPRRWTARSTGRPPRSRAARSGRGARGG